ncbi:MAG: hypothetical protein WD768_07065 [Phycisphaeraceae bacterium]
MAKLASRFGKFVQWFKRSKQTPAVKAEPTYRTAPGTATAVADPEPAYEERAIEAPSRRITKENAIDKLTRGYEEVVDLMTSVRSHMQQQSERSERLLTMLQGLPDALKSLPEATRSQTRTLETIQSSLASQAQNQSRLTDALTGLAKTTHQHELAMTAIGQQLDAGHQRSEQILSSFTALSGTLGRMSEATEMSTGLLQRIAQQESQAAEQVRQLFLRNQKQMTTMSVISWSLALVALTVAGYVAVSVGKIAGMSPAAVHSPTVSAPTAPQVPAATPPTPPVSASISTNVSPPAVPLALTKPAETESFATQPTTVIASPSLDLLNDMPIFTGSLLNDSAAEASLSELIKAQVNATPLLKEPANDD